jgi:signal transduction histidine kinase
MDHPFSIVRPSAGYGYLSLLPIPNLGAQEASLADLPAPWAEVLGHLLQANWALAAQVQQRAESEGQLRSDLERLRELLEKEKNAGRINARVVALASHEFRTPLSTILSSAALARRYADDLNTAKRDAHFEKIRLMVNHLNGILQDIFQTSEIERDHVRVRPSAFDFCQLVAESIENVRQSERSDLSICWRAQPEAIEVRSDAVMLLHVVQHLLTNAARYSPGEIFCSAAVQQGMVQFSVEDRGVGIPEAEQGHLFEQFFRATNVNHLPGIGLGLYLSKRYLTLLRGDIRWENARPNGIIFRIVFPKHHAE